MNRLNHAKAVVVSLSPSEIQVTSRRVCPFHLSLCSNVAQERYPTSDLLPAHNHPQLYFVYLHCSTCHVLVQPMNILKGKPDRRFTRHKTYTVCVTNIGWAVWLLKTLHVSISSSDWCRTEVMELEPSNDIKWHTFSAAVNQGRMLDKRHAHSLWIHCSSHR